jgi:hypothetical protein
MSASSKKIVLKKLNSHNTIWHPESTLVFKSQKEKLVIGRFVDEEIIPLDDEALKLCEVWKFKADESLFEEDPEKVDDEEQDETEDEPTPKEPTPKEPTPKEPTPKEPTPKEPKLLPKVSENSSNGRSIRDMTECFTNQVFAEFDLLIEENTSLKSQLEDMNVEFADLQKKYDDIKKKFDTMKSLFN